MKDRRMLTSVYELARAKLRKMGDVGGGALQTRIGVIKLVEALTGPCIPGDELRFLNAFNMRDTAPVRTTWRKGDYKLPMDMRVAMRKCADQPIPISMNTAGGVQP